MTDMDKQSVALMAGIASAMATDAHHSTRMIEGSLSTSLVDLYDGVKHAHARLGNAMESGNMFTMVSAFDDLSEVLALASIGMERHREVAYEGSGSDW